jgi:hypothetical protein
MNALAPEDHIPHERAIWREEPPRDASGSLPVSVDYGGGRIICTLVAQADWEVAKRWRWGWPS